MRTYGVRHSSTQERVNTVLSEYQRRQDAYFRAIDAYRKNLGGRPVDPTHPDARRLLDARAAYEEACWRLDAELDSES